ncbi:hypothetical protein FRC06_009092, partial [Ceratobasidium sp. 370]
CLRIGGRTLEASLVSCLGLPYTLVFILWRDNPQTPCRNLSPTRLQCWAGPENITLGR